MKCWRWLSGVVAEHILQLRARHKSGAEPLRTFDCRYEHEPQISLRQRCGITVEKSSYYQAQYAPAG